jgi:hypothetical protein
MKYIKEIVMLALMFVLGAAGYRAMEYYYANQAAVKVQFLDFGGDHSDSDYHNRRRHNSSYNEGYQDGLHDGQKNCHCDRFIESN